MQYVDCRHSVLMAREEGTFKENPAGVSSVLFYNATIIIHGKSCK